MEQDITKTGPVGLRGLKGVDQRQEEYDSYWDALLLDTQYSKGVHTGNQYTPLQSVDVGMLLAQAGYGNSKYDSTIQQTSQLEHINDIRAMELSAFSKIGAGALKMGILATTTFADGILGTVAGILNIAGQLAEGNIHSAKDLFHEFLDNPISKMLAEVNEDAEQWLPNYYTEWEKNSPWWTQIGSANFIGDKFLKNLGFTIGAGAAAYLTGGLAGKVFVKKGLKEAFKGAVVTSKGKVLNTGADIYKAYKTGDALMDGAKLSADLAKSAKQLKNAEMYTKLTGALAAAAGEGRIEAIHGMKEWGDAQETYAKGVHEDFLKNLERTMYEENPDWFQYGVDLQGNLMYVLTPEGRLEYNRRIQLEQKVYENMLADIESKKAEMGNSMFGLNLILLGASDLYQWGRFISGGYTAGRSFKNLVKGSMEEGFRPDKWANRKTVLRALSHPLIEAQEEMSQASIQEGSGMWKSRQLNSEYGSFYGSKIDPDAEMETTNWLNSILLGFQTTYGDPSKWEEGFIGGLTGLLGMPTIKTNSKGKKRPALAGELWQGLRDAKEIREESNSAAEYLNNRIKNPEFLNYYLGLIRHTSEQNVMDEALERGDNFDFQNSKFRLMISDIIMFDKAGRLDDLYDIIEQASNLSEDDIQAIKESTIDKETGKSVFEGKTDELIIETIQGRALEMKKAVDFYAKTSTDLKTLYGDKIAPDVLEELSWGLAQVDNWESRMKELCENVRKPLADKAEELNKRFGLDINVVLDRILDFADNLSEEKNLIDEIIQATADKNASVQEVRDRIESLIKEKELQRRDSNLTLGRKVLEIRRNFNKSRERISKQRDKTLKEIEKVEQDKAEIQGEPLETPAFKALNELKQELKELEEELEKNEGNPYKGTAAEKAENRQILEELKAQIANAEDHIAGGINSDEQSLFEIMDKLNSKLLTLEGKFNSETIFDKRRKLGYVPGGQKLRKPKLDKDGVIIRDEHGNVVYEDMLSLEEEERIKAELQRKSLFSQIVALKEMLNDPDNKLVNPLDVEKINEYLIDLIKLYAVRDKFLDTYQALSKNPELFTSEFIKLMESAMEHHNKQEAELAMVNLESVINLQELRTILAGKSPEVIDLIMEEVKKSDNEKLLGLIKEYKAINEISSTLSDIINSLDDAENLPEALKELQEVLNGIEKAEEFEESLELMIKALKLSKESAPVGAVLLTVLDKYKSQKPSKNTNNPDKPAAKPTSKGLKGMSPEEIRRRTSVGSGDDEGGVIETDDEDDEDDEDSSLGPSEDSPQGTNGGPTVGSSVPPSTGQNFSLDKVLKDLDKLSVNELQEIVDDIDAAIQKGLVKDPGTDQDKALLKKICTLLIKLRNRSINIHQTGGSKSTNSESNQSSSTRPAFRSWVRTGYQIGPLKDRGERQAVLNDDPIANALRSLGAYEFVDSGRLGLLLMDNPNLKIHYITTNNNDLKNVVLLAIEVTPEVEEIGTISPIQVGTKQYQVIGSLGYNGGSAKAKDIWSRITLKLFQEREKALQTNPNQAWVISKIFTNTISHIFSGRMVTSTPELEKKQRPLREVLGPKARPRFGIYYSDSNFKTLVPNPVPLNSHNENPREGSVWLMVLEADGRYYAKAVKIKRFTKSEYDLDEYENSPILLAITDFITDIADSSKSDYQRAMAKLYLQDYFYFPGDALIYFTGDVVSIKDANGKTIANDIGKGLSLEEKVRAILEALQDDTLNLRFQIDANRVMDDTDYIDEIMESDIITADIVRVPNADTPHNVNASFEMPLLDPETGRPLENLNEGPTTGHTGKRGINNDVSKVTVVINGKEYRIDLDGNVWAADNVQVTDEKKLAEVRLQALIDRGEIEPVEGSSDLYIGWRLTSAGFEKFGLVKGHVKTGAALQTLEERALKNKEKAEKEKERAAKKKRLEVKKTEPKPTDDNDTEFDWEEGSTLEELLFDKDSVEPEDEEGPSPDKLDNDQDQDDEPADWEEGLDDVPEGSLWDDDELSDDLKSTIPKNSSLTAPNKTTPTAGTKMGEEFDADFVRQSQSAGTTPLGFINKNRGKLILNGTKVPIKEWKETAASLGYDINTIDTLDKMDAMIQEVDCASRRRSSSEASIYEPPF